MSERSRVVAIGLVFVVAALCVWLSLGRRVDEETDAKERGAVRAMNELDMIRAVEEDRLEDIGDVREQAPVEPAEAVAPDVEEIVSPAEDTREETGGSIEGVVVDRNGLPVEAAWVMARGLTNGDTKSVEGGAFRLAGLAAATYSLRVVPPGVRGFTSDPETPLATVAVAEGQAVTGVRLVMEDYGDISVGGIVVDDRGVPIAEAMLSVHVAVERNRYFKEEAATRDDGTFLIEHVPDGECFVSVTHDLYDSREPEWQFPAGTMDAVVTMNRRGSVSGRVVDDATGEGIDSFRVYLIAGGYPNDGASLNTVEMVDGAFQGADGYFTMAGLSPGTATVSVVTDDYAKERTILEGIEPGEDVTDLLIRLKRGATVEGVVLAPGGAPVEGASIHVGRPQTSRYAPIFSKVAGSLEDGAFRIDGLPGAVDLLTATHEQYGDGVTSVTLKAGATTHVEIVLGECGSIEGVVRLDGKPVSEASVSVPEEDAPKTGTGPDGTYRLEFVKPGARIISARLPDSPAMGELTYKISKQISLREGERHRVDFEFTSAVGAIEGYVTYRGGAAVSPRVSIQAAMADGAYLLEHCGVDKDGYFHDEGLPEGDVVVEVGSRQSGRQIVRQAARIQPGQVVRLDFDLGSGATVHGVVDGMAGAPSAYVLLFSGDVDPRMFTATSSTELASYQQWWLQGPAEVDDSGAFVLEGVPAGRYFAMAFINDEDAAPGEFRTGYAPVEVKEEWGDVEVAITVR